MAEWRGIIIQAVSSIIASTVFLSGITNYYYEFYNQPKLVIDITPNNNEDYRSVTINVTNNGVESAKNLLLTIRSPGDITDSRIFYTENLTIDDKLTKDDLLQVHIPRFIHGEGSLVSLDISSNCSPAFRVLVTEVTDNSTWKNYSLKNYSQQYKSIITKINNTTVNCTNDVDRILKKSTNDPIQINWIENENKTEKIANITKSNNTDILGLKFRNDLGPVGKYIVYATYDQGSVTQTGNNYPLLNLKEQLFRGLYDIVTQLSFLDAIAGASVLILIIPFAHKIHSNKEKPKKARFMFEILNEIITIRNILNRNILEENIIRNDGISKIWSSKTFQEKLTLIDNKKDYVIIDHFFSKIIARNSYIDNTINKTIEITHRNEDIKQYNKECLKLAYDTLKTVNWEKYNLSSVGIYPHKNPKFASIIALLAGAIFLSGMGHIYIGRLQRAIAILIASTTLRILTIMATLRLAEEKISINADLRNVDFVSRLEILDFESINEVSTKIIETIPGTLYLIFALIYIGLWIWQIFDARKLAKQYNEYVKEFRKEPW
jgi:hypothetical protein